MADEEFPIWLIVIIAVVSVLCVIFLICGLIKCCKWMRTKPETFAWLDRLGIPFAKEGTPDETTFPNLKQLRVQISHQEVDGNTNGGFEVEKGKMTTELEVVTESTSEFDDDVFVNDPFKRLDQLGIPRARREKSPTPSPGVKRPPRNPLPSPSPDYYDSSDDENTEP